MHDKCHYQKKYTVFRWFLVVFGPFILLTIGLLSREDKNFSLDKIRPTQKFALQKSRPYSLQEIREVRDMLSQPYTFLTEGKEEYVFVSRDQKYVLKFFNMRKMTPKYWLRHVPLPWLDGRRLKKVEERERMREEVFRSLKISFEQFRYQTGLMFLHLFKTDYLQTKVCVKDKWGISHYIPMDAVPFALQRKATPLSEHIDHLVKEGKEEETIHSLCQVLELVQEACERGFSDPSDRVRDHYGFIQGRPILIGGRLVQNESLMQPDNVLREVFRVSRLLESWLEKCYPELLPSFQSEIQNIFTVLEDN
ncbi:MAG: hypothetical protein FJZ58_01025 [Chlamydiae bacterium]|nr:hypothetical protein [Chlamydiota bacterium]